MKVERWNDLHNNGELLQVGFEANVGQFPWYVHIQGYLESRLSVVCGGSIISSNWVMTEAFCGLTSSSWHLYFRETLYSHHNLDSSEAIISNEFIMHPLYNQPNFIDNNIGLIKSSSNIELTMGVEAIALPWAAFDEDDISAYYVGTRMNGNDSYNFNMQFVLNCFLFFF